MDGGTVFGFLDGKILEGLRTYGNWKIRQGAIDALLAAVEEARFDDSSSVDIPKCIDFFFELLDDPNFKIKQGGIQAMKLLIKKLAKNIELHSRDSLLPRLVGKLADPKDYVREGVVSIIKAIAEGTGILKVLLALKQFLHSVQYRLREEIVLLFITAVLWDLKQKGSADSMDQYLTTVVFDALKEAVCDSEGNVAAYAAEGFRLLRTKMEESEFWKLLLHGGRLPDNVIDRIRRRCLENTPIAYLNSKDCVALPGIESDGTDVAIKTKVEPLYRSTSSQREASRDAREDDALGCLVMGRGVSTDSNNQDEAKTSTQSIDQILHRRPSLRSYPLLDDDLVRRKASDSSERDIRLSTSIEDQIPGDTNDGPTKRSEVNAAVNDRPVNKTSASAPSNADHVTNPKKEEADSSAIAVSRPEFYQRLFQSQSQPGRKEQARLSPIGARTAIGSTKDDALPTTQSEAPMARKNTENVAARIDRIAKLIRQRDVPRLKQEDIAPPSKSASVSKKRENLDILKMKQKERRTQSANAILQTNEKRPMITDSSSIQRQDFLPAIRAKPAPKDIWAEYSLKRAANLSDDNRNRIEQQNKNRTVQGSSVLPDGADEDIFDSPSSPGSIAHSRPGTFTSGVSFSANKAVHDITTTDPFLDPEAVLLSVIDRLKAANNARKKEVDWLSQAEALIDARRLVYHHRDTVKKHRRDLIMAYVPAMQQLRSSTARTAITLCQEILEALGETLEHEIDDIVPLLLRKAGETSNAGRDTFLASEADKALSAMIRRVPCLRSLNALLQNASNSSKYVRSKVAAHLDDCLEVATKNLKAAAHLSLIDRIFRVAVSFLEEGSQQTRTHGKRILWHLKGWINNKGAFDRLLGQLETDTKKRRVGDVLDDPLGPPPLPAKTPLPHAKRRHQRGSLIPLTPALSPPGRVSDHDTLDYGTSQTDASSLATADEKSSPREFSSEKSLTRASDVQVCTVRRPPKPSTRVSSQSCRGSSAATELPESMSEVLTSLSSKDWRTRIEALQQLEAASGNLRHVRDRDLLNVMDQLTFRLNDGNSKVVLVTLETMKSVIGKTGKNAVPSLNTVVPAIVAHLASSADKIRAAAESTLDQLICSVDGVYLVQNLSHCCAHGNARTKAVLLQKLESVTDSVQARKPQFVLKYILPVAFSALGDIQLDVREANAHLLRTLVRTVGRPFIERAESLTGSNRQRLFDILHGNH